MLYLSRQIYESAADRDGAPLQGARRYDEVADSRPAADGRGLRLSYPREPANSSAEGLAPSRVPAPIRAGRHATRRPLGALSTGRQLRSNPEHDPAGGHS